SLGAQFITEASSVTYLVSPLALLDNFVIATWGPSNSQLTFSAFLAEVFGNPHPYDFLEFNGIAIHDNVLVSTWADNSHTPVNDGQGNNVSKTTNIAFSRIDIKTKGNKIKLTTIVPPEYIRPSGSELQVETNVAISAVNPNFIALVSARGLATITFVQPPF